MSDNKLIVPTPGWIDERAAQSLADRIRDGLLQNKHSFEVGDYPGTVVAEVAAAFRGAGWTVLWCDDSLEFSRSSVP